MPLKAEIDKTDINAVQLSWALPTENYAGENAAPTGIKIYRLGTSGPIATLGADATTYTDNATGDGKVTYEVIPLQRSRRRIPGVHNPLCRLRPSQRSDRHSSQRG